MSEDRTSVCSFVLRCTPCESLSGWRIKVTHVQEQVELTMGSLDEANLYMKRMLERRQKHDGKPDDR
ncbi:hypothetical protein [Paenibacillus sp.]|jgi:hypothetical protein|uniref:hypothetical protein n=1 Tax=Paenibacillus sp. TaxID=58172 RepID=UPI0028217880|nr:hypothetical protein [Paenibacillus sp.]MDR0270560.1 hypothetical protein [Paenibacillus sp.]